MKDIAIFGAGGFGKEVACMIRMINENKPQWHIVGFFDDNPLMKGKMISHYGPCLGSIDDLNNYDRELALAIAIGNPQIVKKTYSKINNPRIYFPNLIMTDFSIADKDSFTIGKGNIIQSNCTVSCDVEIGDFNVLNGSVVLGHDVKVGSFNTIMPAVRLSGEVEVGNECFFGVGSIVLQQIKMKDSITLGAGSVLMRKPKSNCLYIGVPATLFKY